MFVRKLVLAATIVATLTGVLPAAASPAVSAEPVAASAAADSGSAVNTRWYIEGYYDILTCYDRGSFGLNNGSWLNYNCEQDYGNPDPNIYRLWVEVQGSSTGPCATAGHAYLINGSTLYFSGYEGNYQNGIATTSVPSGFAVIGLGGNGISPQTTPQFKLQLNGMDVPGHSWNASKAGSNCVSNQVNKTMSLQAGQTYTLKVQYTAGNGNSINETVVYIYAY